MTKTIISLAWLLITTLGISQVDNIIYSKVKIDLTTTTTAEIAALGLEADHGDHAHGKHLINIYSQYELGLLDDAGIDYEIVIPDAQAFYKEHGTMDENASKLISRNENCRPETTTFYDYKTPRNYTSGTMGGYLPYTGVLENLDLMSELYPNLITNRISIDTIKTHEGRSLYYLVISNSPNSIDSDKPQILYSALHHAREPNGVSQLLFYMWYLLENYGKDEEVTFLVDNTTMFFLPMVNPDGYVYNERTNPEGGGLWRKNRYRNPSGQVVGVDLNRNYGHFWAHNNSGSSNSERSQTYRGPAPFSEPETQAVRKLCNDNNFRIGLNNHTYGNLLIHPWSYEDRPSEEDVLYKSIGKVMTTDNEFKIGTALETVRYTVNGNSDDWMYGEEDEKDKIYAMTPEFGPEFWPSFSLIDQLNKSGMRFNLNAAHLLLNYGWLEERFETSTVSERGVLFFEFEKSGLENEVVNIDFVSETDGFTLSNNQYSDISMEAGELKEMTINYSTDPGFEEGEVNIAALIDYGTYTQRIPFTKRYFGNNNVADYSDLDSLNDLSNIELGGDWDLTTEDYYSAPSCMTDSPNDNYSNTARSEIHISKVFIAENAEEIYVKFQTRFDIEQDYDYVQFQVSADNGPYTPVCGELTTDSRFQFVDTQPVYQGIRDWSQEVISLEDFIGAKQLRFKFVLYTDTKTRRDGFYFDDFTYLVYGDEYVPYSDVAVSTISIRPNPVDDKVTIQISRSDFDLNVSYQIHDMTGRLVLSGALGVPEQEIDVSGLQQGTYIISVLKADRIIGNERIFKN